MTSPVITPRNTIAAALLLSAAGFVASELIERVGGLVPCELCLIERWSVFAAAVFLGLCWVSSAPWLSVSGLAGTALATLVSLAAAMRHVWLQTHPGEPLGCLPDIFGHTAAAAPPPSPASDLVALANPLQSLSPAPSACSQPQAVTLGFTVADWGLAYAVILTLFVVGVFAVGIRARQRAAAQVRA
jgi:disulfide bond formation protein DsbB